MKVFKFGGASVKDGPSIRNMGAILSSFTPPVMVVISAMGKTTNHLEVLVKAYMDKSESKFEILNEIKSFHLNIVEELFPDKNSVIYKKFQDLFDLLKLKIKEKPALQYNFEYDQIVSYGELLSTLIIAEYLKSINLKCKWLDIRNYLKTDNTFREANINWNQSDQLLKSAVKTDEKIYWITQGFIGSNQYNSTTTLGREGSDFTAAILAYIFDAESVTVWKDVPGILNADPKYFDDTVKLKELSYTDTIELAYYGMQVIHPRTIQPLQRKNIPLYVKSFIDPSAEGTVIADLNYQRLMPCFIFKMNQVLINISPKDLSFINENILETIFGVFSKYGLRINLMQNSAVNFKACVTIDEVRIPEVMKDLEKNFMVSHKEHLELITIRYYDQTTIDRVLVNKEVLLEQKSKHTIQMVVTNS